MDKVQKIIDNLTFYLNRIGLKAEKYMEKSQEIDTLKVEIEFKYDLQEMRKNREENHLSGTLLDMVEKFEEITEWHHSLNVIKVQQHDTKKI